MGQRSYTRRKPSCLSPAESPRAPMVWSQSSASTLVMRAGSTPTQQRVSPGKICETDGKSRKQKKKMESR